MKKILFLLLLLCPIFVFAAEDITIDNIQLVEKSDKVVELEQVKNEGLKIWFNLKFVDLNDYAKYEFDVINSSDIDYKLSDGSDFKEESYISYVYEGNDDLVIKAGETKNVVVKVVYSKKVENKDFVDNVYKSENNMSLSFVKEEKVENPNTSSELIGISCLLFFVSLVLVIYGSKRKRELMILILGFGLIPLITKAVELLKIDINVKVEIAKQVEMGTFSLCYEDDVFQFEKGMTFEEWMESDYNTSDYEFDGDVSNILMPNDAWIILGDYPNYKYIDKTDLIEEEYYECMNIAECVAPDSKILIRENLSMYAKDIKENDYIMYYDFNEKEMKRGSVKKVYVHKDATNFIRYTLEDGSYLEATDYHPIYTKDGWKSYTNRNGYEKPVIGDMVKTNGSYVKIANIETYTGKEDFYDFSVIDENGKLVDNYYANGMLVHSAYEKSR